ncbi:hypothetical protein MG293_011987 [Ovis ammon polii]|uniref:Uncharacterized protein n=1 Tax=Ovis ammon polii TaxID=230172 RepID=A0AAD4Y8E4_OVIAM|nr:hypothetical protein MG293_011987 [Ovis ammon polii]
MMEIKMRENQSESLGIPLETESGPVSAAQNLPWLPQHPGSALAQEDTLECEVTVRYHGGYRSDQMQPQLSGSETLVNKPNRCPSKFDLNKKVNRKVFAREMSCAANGDQRTRFIGPGNSRKLVNQTKGHGLQSNSAMTDPDAILHGSIHLVISEPEKLSDLQEPFHWPPRSLSRDSVDGKPSHPENRFPPEKPRKKIPEKQDQAHGSLEEQVVTHCDILSKSRSDPTTRVPSADFATTGAPGPTCVPSLPAHDGPRRQRQWLLSRHTWVAGGIPLAEQNLEATFALRLDQKLIAVYPRVPALAGATAAPQSSEGASAEATSTVLWKKAVGTKDGDGPRSQDLEMQVSEISISPEPAPPMVFLSTVNDNSAFQWSSHIHRQHQTSCISSLNYYRCLFTGPGFHSCSPYS